MLRCVECGREIQPSEDARGWRTFLTQDPAYDYDVRGHSDGEDDEVPGVAIYFAPDAACDIMLVDVGAVKDADGLTLDEPFALLWQRRSTT
jgi:hypothetical protein